MTNHHYAKFWSVHGRPGYLKRIDELEARKNGTNRDIKLQKEIDEIEQSAADRYDDLASDPLP